MAYMNPRQYLDLLTKGRGGRATVYPGPSGALQASGDFLGRTGANKGWRQQQAAGQQRRAATGAYSFAPQSRAPSGPSALQQGMQNLARPASTQRGGQRSGYGGGGGMGLGTAVASGVAPPGRFITPGGYDFTGLSSIAMKLPTQGVQGASGPTLEDSQTGPQGMMSKIGGFLGRPGIGEAMTALGATWADRSAAPGASWASGLGPGTEAATQAFARSREEARLEAERTEKARREQAARDAILGDETLTDADRNLLITMVESGDLAGALDRRDRIVDVAGLTARMEGIEGLSGTDRSTIISLAREDLGAANQFLEDRMTNIDFGVLRQDVFDADDELEDPVFSSTKREWLNLLPGEMASSVIMDALADEEMRPAVREGLKYKYFGYDPQAILTQDQEDMLDGMMDDLEVGTALLGAPTAQITSVEAADGSVQVYRSGILLEILPAGVAKDVPPGLVESLPALKDFSDNFYSDQVEYLASRTDLNRLLETASDGDFGRLNTLGHELLGLMEGGGSDLEVSKVQAEFLTALNTIGFQNLSLFVGPTSDFEAGLAQMIQGSLVLDRAHLQRLASRQLRQRLNLWARHNDRVERAAARLPEGSFLRGEAEAHYIKLMAEDVPGFTLDEWQREMAARSGAGGGSRILFEGKFPVTGAQTERSESVAEGGGTAGNYWDFGGNISGGALNFDPLGLVNPRPPLSLGNVSNLADYQRFPLAYPRNQGLLSWSPDQ